MSLTCPRACALVVLLASGCLEPMDMTGAASGGDAGRPDAEAEGPPPPPDRPPPPSPLLGGRPFGSHPFAYPAGATLPSGGQAALDDAVRAAYDRWKAAYVKEGCGGRFVLSGGGTGPMVGDEVSEGHGYGMTITAMMAGHDPEARAIFDGMVAFFHRFPSARHADLMAWTANAWKDPPCTVPGGGVDSATDGDLDIAFALLLADRQWGGGGAVDYRGEARKVIAAIKAMEMSEGNKTPHLGDWAPGDATYGGTVRSSDFMLDHFRAFAAATGDPFWNQAIDAAHGVIARVMAPATGLLPDFIVDAGGNPAPAPAGFFEGPADGEVGYNACRVPWRLATDWIASGDPRSRAAVERIATWIEGKTHGDPAQVIDGYALDGADRGNGNSNAFEAPLGLAGIVGGAHQAWVDAAWRRMATSQTGHYYGDSIQLLTMIVLSGNWWVP